NPEKVQLYNGGKYDTKKYIKLFANDKAGKAGRSTWYLTTLDNIPENKELVSEWQVTVSSANAGGQKRDNQIAIIDNNSAFARSRLALKSFKTKEEAENFFEYATSKFIEYAFLLTDENLSSLAKRVPDIGDYKSSTSLIDFTSNIDEQLYSLLGLTEDEIEHIEETLTNLR
ncbi:MAG: restriction endonuclease, partial [Clostridiales bacterium]|nr:restriction endonuclease [Clostridiales bacterium]